MFGGAGFGRRPEAAPWETAGLPAANSLRNPAARAGAQPGLLNGLAALPTAGLSYRAAAPAAHCAGKTGSFAGKFCMRPACVVKFGAFSVKFGASAVDAAGGAYYNNV